MINVLVVPQAKGMKMSRHISTGPSSFIPENEVKLIKKNVSLFRDGTMVTPCFFGYSMHIYYNSKVYGLVSFLCYVFSCCC